MTLCRAMEQDRKALLGPTQVQARSSGWQSWANPQLPSWHEDSVTTMMITITPYTVIAIAMNILIDNRDDGHRMMVTIINVIIVMTRKPK